ncbi:unnamed protein product [Caenorhabditis nigoni]
MKITIEDKQCRIHFTSVLYDVSIGLRSVMKNYINGATVALQKIHRLECKTSPVMNLLAHMQENENDVNFN